jgi:hypothetical protein
MMMMTMTMTMMTTTSETLAPSLQEVEEYTRMEEDKQTK